MKHRLSLSDEEISLLIKALTYYIKCNVQTVPVDLREEPFKLLKLYSRLKSEERHRPRFYHKDALELLESIKLQETARGQADF